MFEYNWYLDVFSFADAFNMSDDEEGNQVQLKYSSADQEYQQVMLLERYRDLLLQRKEAASAKAKLDITNLSREIKPKIFGWKPKPEPDQADLQSMWTKLSELESLKYPLEKDYANDLFKRMETLMIGDDLKGIDPLKLQKHYHHLLPKPLRVPQGTKLKQPQKPTTKTNSEPKKESTSSKYIRQLLIEKQKHEQQLQEFRVPKFRAQPLPLTTFRLVSNVMERNANRASILRAQTAKKQIQTTKSASANANEARNKSKQKIPLEKPSPTLVQSTRSAKKVAGPHPATTNPAPRKLEKPRRVVNKQGGPKDFDWMPKGVLEI